jgi:plastocyanin
MTPRAKLAIAPVSALLSLAWAGLATTPSAAAQDILDRSVNLSSGWIGLPWTLHAGVHHRVGDDARAATFTGTLGLPHASAAGLAWVSMATVPGGADELEAFFRHRLLSQTTAPADVALTAAWNTDASSFDAEAALARRFGSLRLGGAARWFSDVPAAGEARFAAAGGVVWHPLPRSAPLALAADVAAPLDLAEGEDVAWSASVQAGIPHTALTVSLRAANTRAPTLQGSTFAAGATRFGLELTAPIPVGYFVGLYPSRESAMESVAAEPEEPADEIVEIRRYAYVPQRIVVRAGSVVEWVNHDAVVHTATAEDDAWDSGGIQPGSSWRARFDRPGTYPYFCGPHPFMKGVVEVR